MAPVGASNVVASTALSPRPKSSFVKNAAPPHGHDLTVSTTTGDHKRRALVPEAARIADRRVESSRSATVDVADRCQGSNRADPARNRAIVEPELGTKAAIGWRWRESGRRVGDDQRATLLDPAHQVVGLVGRKSIPQDHGDVITQSGQAHGQVDVGANTTQELDESTRAQGAIRPGIERRAVTAGTSAHQRHHEQ